MWLQKHQKTNPPTFYLVDGWALWGPCEFTQLVGQARELKRGGGVSPPQVTTAHITGPQAAKDGWVNRVDGLIAYIALSFGGLWLWAWDLATVLGLAWRLGLGWGNGDGMPARS